jgi:hypothetical protein
MTALEQYAVECAKVTCPELDPAGFEVNARGCLRAMYQTAVHEVAHAVVAQALGSDVRSVWLAPKWCEARVAGLCEHDTFVLSKEENVMVSLAGPLAEELLDSRDGLGWEDFADADTLMSSTGWRDDFKNIRRLLHAPLYGRRVHRLAAHTEDILRTHWRTILILAKRLLTGGAVHKNRGVLSGTDVRSAMGLSPTALDRHRAAS